MDTSQDLAPHPVTNDTIATATETRTVHRCEKLKRDGTVCGFYVGTVFYDGGWACAHHRPRNKPKDPNTPRRLPKAPVTDLKEPADAVRLAAWAAIQSARGRLPKQYASAVLDACREFRAGWALAQDTQAADELIKATCDYWKALQLGDDRAAQAAQRTALDAIGELLGHRPEASTTPGPGYELGEKDPVWGERLA